MFEIWPKISLSETEFIEKHGLSADEVEVIKKKVTERQGKKCLGCQLADNTKELHLHLVEENEKKPKSSIFVCLCKECHLIEHIDQAIEGGFVKLVNSYFKQAELVTICRDKSLARNISAGNIEILKKEPETYLEELRSGSLGKNRIKVVFSPKKYSW